MKNMYSLCNAFTLVLIFNFFVCDPCVYAGEDLDYIKKMLFVTNNATGKEYFSDAVQSDKVGYAGALKVTVTTNFVKENRTKKQNLMKIIYDSWKILYTGKDDPIIAFVDSDNVAYGIASKKGCMVAPVTGQVEEKKKKNKCYLLGYKYGRCFAMSLGGLECYQGDDISMPPECRYNEDKDRGLMIGIKEGKKVVDNKMS